MTNIPDDFAQILEKNKKLSEQVKKINDELTEEVKMRAENIIEGDYVV
ncbi:MAG: hypothetical protein QM490_06020 [Candidatus Gracilibacteria bacterium]